MKKISLIVLSLAVMFSSCTKDYSYEGGQPGVAGNDTIASGTLGPCISIVINGNYSKGIVLSSANTLQIEVNVSTAGTYQINTNNLDGISFQKSGFFAATGLQTLLLQGSGSPVNAGTYNFIVYWGGGNCAAEITIDSLNTLDYFPITLHSSWAYKTDNGTSLDSLLTNVISYAPTFTGKTYSCITTDEVPATNPKDSAYYRKNSGLYYQYLNVSSIYQFDAPTFSEYIFLNDNLDEGSSWQTQVYTGTAGTFGAATGYIKMTIVAKAVSATVGVLNFPDVIKVHYEFYRSLPHGDPFATEDRWFARGVGLVYDNSSSTITSFRISNLGRYMIY